MKKSGEKGEPSQSRLTPCQLLPLLASPSSPGRGKSFPRGELYLVAVNFVALPKSSPFGRAGEEQSDETERVPLP